MKRLAFIFAILASPAFGEGANYHAIDEMQERANAYIAALESQRNAALNQVVALTAELEKAKKSKECKAGHKD